MCTNSRERVCVFIDWCSVVLMLDRLYPDVRLDFVRLKNWLVGDRIGHLRYYTGDANAEKRNDFYGFLNRVGFNVVKCKHPLVTENEASARRLMVKTACHNAMLKDLCEAMQSQQFDTIVLVTGAKEFSIVAKWVRVYGINLEVVFFDKQCDYDLVNAADKYRSLPCPLPALSVRKTDVVKKKTKMLV